VQNFSRLRVWRDARALAVAVHTATKALPRREWFGLGAQLRNAAVSVPSNIAEGCGRASRKDFARFLSIAIGSTCELETQLLIAADLSHLDGSDDLIASTQRLRQGLIKLRISVLDQLTPLEHEQM
jgi:four helix bundle protein